MAPLTIDNDGVPLLVFETASEYHRNNAIEGYWGPVRSSIDWCERNYVVSFYVAEMVNTVSNLGFACLGLAGAGLAMRHGLETRFVLAYLGTALVGFGSALFHGTLTHVAQQGDETPMVIGVAIWLWALAFQDPAFEARHPTLLRHSPWVVSLLVSAFACLHYVMRFTVGFQVMIASLVLIGIWRVSYEWARCTDATALWIGRRCYVGSGILAFALWNVDCHFCATLHDGLPGGLRNPQFHAWWHMLMAVMCYSGPTFLAYERLVRLGAKPTIRYALGVLPYVAISERRRGAKVGAKAR